MAGWRSTTGTATRPGLANRHYFGAHFYSTGRSGLGLATDSRTLFRPEADFEVAGFVPNVVFPTGVVQDRDALLVYYGAADAVTAVAEFSLGELLGAMTAPG